MIQIQFKWKAVVLLTQQIREGEFWKFLEKMAEEKLTAELLCRGEGSVLAQANLVRRELTPLWDNKIKRVTYLLSCRLRRRAHCAAPPEHRSEAITARFLCFGRDKGLRDNLCELKLNFG